MMSWKRAKAATESLEDVFTDDGYAVVIDQLRNYKGMMSARAQSGGTEGPYSQEWVPLIELTAKEDLK